MTRKTAHTRQALSHAFFRNKNPAYPNNQFGALKMFLLLGVRLKINVRDTGKLKPRHMSPNIEINNDIEGRNASGTDTQNGVVQEGQRMKAGNF